MAKAIVPDDLWELIKDVLPPERPKPKGGRPRVPDRAALAGILFVLRSGIPWEMLPQEMGCGSGMTCWRRLREWQEAEVWDKLHRILLARLNGAGQLDWSRAVVDSASVRAVWGGAKTGPNPTDRAKKGSKHHVIVDARGVPLACRVTAANVHDVTQLLELVDAIPPLQGKRGRPRHRPQAVQGDRAYDSEPHPLSREGRSFSGVPRRQLRARNVEPELARRRTGGRTRLGKTRWVVERTLAWLHQFRRLRIRWERRADIHHAFLTIGCTLITYNFWKAFC